MRKSYHSTAVPITLDHTIRRKLAASSGATFRVTSSATVIDLSRKYRHHGKQLVLSAEPIGSRDGKNDHVYCWKSTPRNAANAAPSCRVPLLHYFSADFGDIPGLMLTISALLLEISAHEFSFGIHLRPCGRSSARRRAGSRAASVAKGASAVRETHACLTSAKRQRSGPTSARRGSPRA